MGYKSLWFRILENPIINTLVLIYLSFEKMSDKYTGIQAPQVVMYNKVVAAKLMDNLYNWIRVPDTDC